MVAVESAYNITRGECPSKGSVFPQPKARAMGAPGSSVASEGISQLWQ